jgi:hypothetical protein
MFLHFTSYQFQHHHEAGLTFCVKLLCFLSLFDSFAHYTVGKVHHAILYTTNNTTYIHTSGMIVKVVKAMRYILLSISSFMEKAGERSRECYVFEAFQK